MLVRSFLSVMILAGVLIPAAGLAQAPPQSNDASRDPYQVPIAPPSAAPGQQAGTRSGGWHDEASPSHPSYPIPRHSGSAMLQRLPPTSGGPGANSPTSHGDGQGARGAAHSAAAPAQGPQSPHDSVPHGSTGESEIFKPATVVALVGGQPILAGDILPTVDQVLEPHKDQMPEDVYQQQRWLGMRQFLPGVIDSKLLYYEFVRNIPAERKEEALTDLRQRVFEQFREEALPEILEENKLESAADFDAQLRRYGSSLVRYKETFMERELGRAAVMQKIDREPEVTHWEMLEYYRQNAEKYDIPARARWEQLTVLFSRFDSKEAAWNAIRDMYNEIYLGGTPFSAVAKRASHGPTAHDGGYHDWTTRGSLRSEVLDEAIFHYGINQLSPILEDEWGFHVIRVIEREDATRIPFLEAQVEIKEKLKGEKRMAQIERHVNQLRREVSVWTIFDDERTETAVSEPPSGHSRR